MNSTPLQRSTLRLAITLCSVTFPLLLLGGIVHPTGSSLACPDWPTCYGSLFPEHLAAIDTQLRIEHTHRVIAFIVGLLALALALSLSIAWRGPGIDIRRIRRLGWVAALLVLFQGILGGATVLLGLSPIVSSFHFTVSMLFFLTGLALCHALIDLVRGKPSRPPPPVDSSRLQKWGFILTLVVYAQMILGAFVRHTGAGYACGETIPLCLGHFWPAHWPGQLQMVHRLLGVGLFIATLRIAQIAISAVRPSLLTRLSLSLPILCLCQLTIGSITVISRIGLIEVTIHLAVGIMMLAISYTIYNRSKSSTVAIAPTTQTAVNSPSALPEAI